jgi:Family of unknown function (DUF6496)
MALTGEASLPLQLEKTDRRKRTPTMPASEIQGLFKRHQLHSGPGGPIVKKPEQAKAIQLSYARKEGADIPDKPKRKTIGQRLAEHASG